MSALDAGQQGEPTKAAEPILSNRTRKRTPSRLRTFLNTYSECGSVQAAAKVAGIHRSMHYRKLEIDADYRKAFDGLQDRVGQELEDLALERVRNGVRRQIFWRGKPIRQNGRLVYETEYDTQLHITMLKRFRPTLYREHVAQEVTGSLDITQRQIVERLQEGRKRLLEMKMRDDSSAG